MNIKKLLLILIIFPVVALVGCFGKYTVETVIDDEEVIGVSFEYNPKKFKEYTDVIYVKTKEKTYVIRNENVEFVKSDKSTLTQKDKIIEVPMGEPAIYSYFTIKLDPEAISKVSELYAKEKKETLEILNESKHDINN